MAIIVIIVVVVVAYIMINKQPASKKRSIQARGVDFGSEAPVIATYAQSKIVVPGVGYDGTETEPLSRFAGHGKPKSLAGRSLAGRFVIPGASFREDPTADEKRYVVPNTPFEGDGSTDKRFVNVGDDPSVVYTLPVIPGKGSAATN